MEIVRKTSSVIRMLQVQIRIDGSILEIMTERVYDLFHEVIIFIGVSLSIMVVSVIFIILHLHVMLEVALESRVVEANNSLYPSSCGYF